MNSSFFNRQSLNEVHFYKLHLPETLYSYLQEHNLLNHCDHEFHPDKNRTCIITVDIEQKKISFDAKPDSVMITIKDSLKGNQEYIFCNKSWFLTTVKLPMGKSTLCGDKRSSLFGGFSEEQCIERTPAQVSHLIWVMDNVILSKEESLLKAEEPIQGSCCHIC